MSLEQRFIELAIAHRAGIEGGNHRSANRAADELDSLRDELYSQPDRGEAILLRLLKNQDARVGGWAAAHLLPINETAAISALEKIASQDKGLVGFSAQMTLRVWLSRQSASG